MNMGKSQCLVVVVVVVLMFHSSLEVRKGFHAQVNQQGILESCKF
jgi:hypothetical protein